MKRFLLMAVFMVLGFALFSVHVSMAGEMVGEYIDDSAITAQVKAIIVKDPDARYFKIDVTTTQGDVVLQGFVNSSDTEKRLIAKIWKIKGVKSVKSLLRVEQKK